MEEHYSSRSQGYLHRVCQPEPGNREMLYKRMKTKGKLKYAAALFMRLRGARQQKVSCYRKHVLGDCLLQENGGALRHLFE
jgi:hypothetical protein